MKSLFTALVVLLASAGIMAPQFAVAKNAQHKHAHKKGHHHRKGKGKKKKAASNDAGAESTAPATGAAPQTTGQ